MKSDDPAHPSRPREEDKIPMVTVGFAVQIPSNHPTGDTKRPVCEPCAIKAMHEGRYVRQIQHAAGNCVDCGLPLTRPKAVAP
jgi:hypothetical protein